jgi:hypothetical protein
VRVKKVCPDPLTLLKENARQCGIEMRDKMTFRELLEKVVFDDVWVTLQKDYSMKNEAFEAYFKVFNQLKKLTPEPNHDDFLLVVARVEDGFEPGTYTYEVFGVKPNNNDHYALELKAWSEWLSFEVVEKCVEEYGAAAFVSHSLYELTFFGFDASDVEVNIKAEIELLNERLSEIENGQAKLVSWDEVCESIGYVDEHTAEEIELQLEQFKRIAAENEKIYQMLLSSEFRNNPVC